MTTDPEVSNVSLRKILDSRGNPTVEADVSTEFATGRAGAPSGASTGDYEAVERPVNDAIESTRAVVEELNGADPTDQQELDRRLEEVDGTENFSGIGANSAVAISMANLKCAAEARGVPAYEQIGGSPGPRLPTPLGNVIGGGEHAKDATDVQEFLVAPTGAPSFSDAAFTNAEIHAAVAEILDERGIVAGKGDEGAWAPSIGDDEAMEILEEAVGSVPDFEVRIGLDVAASELWDPDTGAYVYSDAERSREEQIDYVEKLVREHEIVYVEDPLEEDDFEGFAELTDRVSDTDCLVCGDDLFVTNVDRIEHGIEAGAANCVLIKPNQIGTVSATRDAVETAREAGYSTVMSHRSGETEDATIAHLAVGLETRFIKTGAVGGERTAKLNELIRIEENMNKNSNR